MINHDAESSRGPSPLWSPYLPASTLPPSSLLIFQPTLMYLFTCLWVVRLVLKQIPFPPPTLADPEYTSLSDFRKRLKLPGCFAVYILGMKEVEKVRGHMGGGDHSAKKKSPLARPQDHLTCGFYSWPHNVCVGGGILPFRRQCFPIFPDPTETLQWANIKQGFMKPELIWALKVCETCLGTKGRLSAWEQAKGISFSSHRLPCVFLIDRPRPHLIEMTCSWQGSPAFQVDHLSAGKLSSI